MKTSVLLMLKNTWTTFWECKQQMHFVKKLLFTAILLLSFSPLFSIEDEQNAIDRESPENTQNTVDSKNSKIYALLNEILIASITGTSENPLAVKCAKIARPLAVIFKCPKRIDGRHTITVLDYYLPAHQGLVASTVQYNASEENLEWLDTIFESDGSEFVIMRPKELEKTKSDAEDFLAEEGIEILIDKENAQAENEVDGENESAHPEENENKSENENAPLEKPNEEEAEQKEEHDFIGDFEFSNDNSELEALIQSSNAAIEKEKQEEESVEIVPEKKIKNAENMLSMHSYGNEVFSIKERENRRIFITAFEKKLTRQYFDSKMRIIKRETWDLNGGINGAHKTKIENYTYRGDSTSAERATIIEEDMRYQQKYDENGRLIEQRNFMVLKNPEENKQDGTTVSSTTENSTSSVSATSSTNSATEKKQKVVLKNRTTWKYNANGQISEKYFVEYNYKDENSTQITSRTSKKESYIYKIQDGSPDYFYYEDNILRMQTEYSGQNDYKTTSYFDGGFIVESYYENGMHKKDYYYLNGSLVRSRDYE